MSVRRARADRRTFGATSKKGKANLDELDRRVDALVGDSRCSKLIHLPCGLGAEPPSVTSGCDKCVAALAAWEQMRRDAPPPVTHDPALAKKF
jgi:hypothetical protein